MGTLRRTLWSWSLIVLAACGGGGAAVTADGGVVGKDDAGRDIDSGSGPVIDGGPVIDAAPRPDGSGNTACMGATLTEGLGKGDSLLVGASMEDVTAGAAAWDVRYLYLSGGLADGNGPCTSCLTGCTTTGGTPVKTLQCDNLHGCNWWGCWQYDHDPPGAYTGGFVSKASGQQQIPMITYYEILQGSGVNEGLDEANVAAKNVTFMTRYYNDFRFMLQKVGQARAIIHIEPDFWGYAEQANENPHAAQAAVATANATDCAGMENSIAGMGRCMIAMTRKYAPMAKVGLHGSAWGTKIDVTENKSTTLDVAAEGTKLGTFMLACGADQGDFIVVDASDRDAGYYMTVENRQTFWDATNATLPSFHQAFTWAKALAEKVTKPIVWWQVPVGNSAQNNTTNHYKDNRVDYFFDHPDELIAAHGALMAFGAGRGDQTTPESDGNHLVTRFKAYLSSGKQNICP